MFHSLILFLGALATITNLALGIYLIRHRPYKTEKLSFSIPCFLIGLWGSIHILGSVTSNPILLLELDKMSVMVVVFVPALILLTCLSLTTEEPIRKWNTVLLFSPAILLLVLSFTSMNSVAFIDGEMEYGKITNGPLYDYFIAYFVLYISTSTYVLIQKYRSVRIPQKRNQLLLVGLGISITGLLAIIFNAIISHWFAIYPTPLFGVISTVILTSTVTYAITRYDFFGIRISVKKHILASAILFTPSLVLLVILFTYFYIYQLPGIHFFHVLIIWSLVAFLSFLILYEFVRNEIEKIVPGDRFWFSKYYPYRKEIKNVHFFDNLANDYLKVCNNILGRVNIQLYIVNGSVSSMPHSQYWNEISKRDSIFMMLDDFRTVVFHEELLHIIGSSNISRRKQLGSYIRYMERSRIDIAIPLYLRDDGIGGVITIAAKIDDDICIEQVQAIKKIENRLSEWFSAVCLYHESVQPLIQKKIPS